MDAHELHKKTEPYKFAVKEQWQRLKRSDPELNPFVSRNAAQSVGCPGATGTFGGRVPIRWGFLAPVSVLRPQG